MTCTETADGLSTAGTEEHAQCNPKAPSPHVDCSARLIYFPPSRWLVEFIGISLVIKSLVNKYKTFQQFTQMFYCLTSCWEVTHGADEKNVISILSYPPGPTWCLSPGWCLFKEAKCLPMLLVTQGGNKTHSQWLQGPHATSQEELQGKRNLFS